MAWEAAAWLGKAGPNMAKLKLSHFKLSSYRLEPAQAGLDQLEHLELAPSWLDGSSWQLDSSS